MEFVTYNERHHLIILIEFYLIRVANSMEMNGKNSMSYQLSMENSENISLLLDRYKTLFELLEQNKMNLVKSFLSFDVRLAGKGFVSSFDFITLTISSTEDSRVD
ncbi:unnamed protein product, partial [Vitis vinifera]|uniref:Uncharacterized protein n=1 Tax=Vitis vinifera TaxID=29760 RepID=D7UC36_VITVI